MAPHYELYSNFTVDDALARAGEPKYTTEFQAGEPPVYFFLQPPPNSAALFSTYGGKPFRLVPNPTYERVGFFWWAAEIQRVCDELRRNVPEVCKTIGVPQSYWDLYTYFDAYDIYYRGAQNLWNVINTLAFENQYAQTVVEKEQRMQAEKYTPLFESLAAELLKRPEIQTKLLQWNKQRQQDILQALTMYELQIFEGFEQYPHHFRGVIRLIFERHHDSLRKGLPLTTPTVPADGRIPNVGISQEPATTATLRRHLRDIVTSDPFMDKFAIPNQIINGIVIVDGTSKTAARKARYQASLASVDSHRQQNAVRRNDATGLPPPGSMPFDTASPGSSNGSPACNESHLPTAQRCSSTPSAGGNPAHMLNNPAPEEARVCPGGDHHVDQRLTIPVTMPTPVGNMQHISPTMHQAPPPIRYYDGSRGPSDHRPLPMRQSVFSPSGPVACPMPSYPSSGARDHGMSQGPFAHQIPPHTLPQHPMQITPHTMQQTQQPHQPHMIPPNGGGYMVNTTPPRFQHDASHALANGPEGFRQHTRNSGTRSSSGGKWQPVGSDDIHGPKVVFRRDSVLAEDDVHEQWQGPGSVEPGRQISAASTNGSYQQFNHHHPQQYNNNIVLRRSDGGSIASRSNSRTSANLGYSLSEYGCINANRYSNPYTKFDPCPCDKCSDRDRTIFISRLQAGLGQNEGAKQLLRQHYSKFGQVESIVAVQSNTTSVHLKFTSPTAAVAAVHMEPSAQVSGLGDSPLRVNFRTGSQFFTPKNPNHFGYDTNNQGRPRLDSRPGQGQMMPMPMPVPAPVPVPIGQNNLTAYPNPTQHHHLSSGEPVISPGPMAHTRQSSSFSAASPTEQAMNLLDRAASQSGFGKKSTNEAHDRGMAGPVFNNRPLQYGGSIGTADVQGTATQPTQFGPQLDGTLSSRTSQELVGDIANLTHEIATSREATHHGTPNNGVHTPIQASNIHDSLARSPENGGLLQPGGGGTMDYSTVRIRPAKAQYVPVPAQWRQESASPQSIPGPVSHSQQTQPPTTEHRLEDITTQPRRNSSEAKLPSQSDHQDKQQEDIADPKLKAAETSGDKQTPKELVKVAQSGDAPQEPQGSQPGPQQRQEGPGEVGQTKAGKKRKNNKNRKNQVSQPQPQPTMPQDDPATAPYEAQILAAPAIVAPRLPDSAHARAVSASEPFPAYRDLMSGPQPARQEHGSQTPVSGSGAGGHDPSPSSDASPVTLHARELNPVAQDFVPPPTNACKENVGVEAKHGGGSGNGSGKANNKSKNGKAGRNETKSAKEETGKMPEASAAAVQQGGDGVRGNDDDVRDHDNTSNGQKVDACETKASTMNVKPTEKKDGADLDLKRPGSGTGVCDTATKASGNDTVTATATATTVATTTATTTATPPKKKGKKAKRKAAAKKKNGSQETQTTSTHTSTPTSTSTPTPKTSPKPSPKPSPKSQATESPKGKETGTDTDKDKDIKKDKKPAKQAPAALSPPPASIPVTTSTSAPAPPAAKPAPKTKTSDIKISATKPTTTTTTKTKAKAVPALAPIPLQILGRVVTSGVNGTNGKGGKGGKEVKREVERTGMLMGSINGGLMNGERKGG